MNRLRVRVVRQDDPDMPFLAMEYATGDWGMGTSPCAALVDLAHSLTETRHDLAGLQRLSPELLHRLRLLEADRG